MADDRILREVFLGFIRVHILFHAGEEWVYGAELIDELGRHGYTVSPGTLYPILHGLAQSGLLMDQARVVDGKRRKEYRLTASGLQTLRAAQRQVRELADEVLSAEE
jgi:DNA-binding PadR family transcriptional regulator